MGTLSFAKVPSSTLFTRSTLSPTIIAGDSNFSSQVSQSQVCLKGKVDLSLWRGVGDDDDDDMEMDGGGDSTTRQAHASPQPPASPLLFVSLLASKKSSPPTNSRRTLSPTNALAAAQSLSTSPPGGNSSGSLSPVVIVSEEGGGVLAVANVVDKHGSSKEQRHGTLLQLQVGGDEGGENHTFPLPLHNNKAGLENGVVVAANNGLFRGLHSDARLGEQGESPRNGLGLRQLGTKNSLWEAEGKPQEHKSPPIPSFLSRVDSSQLLRPTQSQSGRERGRSPTRKVEFTGEVGKVKMEGEQSQAEAPAQPTTAPLDKSQKRTESAKDGSSRSRSGSARRPTARTQDILQEIRKMSLASQDALDEKKKAAAGTASSAPPPKKFGRRFRSKRRKAEEEYTDKDRAAAVTLGSKDIKQSLKAKKKRDRKMRLSISFMSGEDYVIGALVGEAGYQMRVKKQPDAALATLNKALEIQPHHKGALVARSQCYLKLGDAESALKDAERTWDPNDNETYIQGLHQYAEALFQLGEFEKALIAFHRGHRVRKDMDVFRIGIQKSQEAIRRAIGDKSATAIPNLDTVLPLIQELHDTKARLGEECDEEALLQNIAKYKLGDDKPPSATSQIDPKVKSKLITRELMGQLYLDKTYLKKFIQRPEVINQQGLARGLRDEACEALKYLESRERFWRQQNPLYSRKNFTTMLKAHAYDVACRERSLSAEPSIAKYLQRRGSVLQSSQALDSGPPTRKMSAAKSTSSLNQLKRRSSEPQLSTQKSSTSIPGELRTGGNRSISKSLKKSASTDIKINTNNSSASSGRSRKSQ